MTLLRQSGSRLARCVGMAKLAALGLCVLTPAHAPAQTAGWTQRMVSGPSPRDVHTMAYDAARGVTVLFGGYSTSSGANDETWEWNGAAWTQRVVSGPSPRFVHAMAYDAARDATVLFGGLTSGGTPNGETWEWNGTVWTQHTVSGPSPRCWHAMAYDAARGVTVLFGGRVGTSTRNGETWEWNGSAWTQRMVTGPSPRYKHAMSYDAARAVTVLFGGESNTGATGETWEWNGTDWTQRVVAGPSARNDHAMAYDSALGVTVLFGGGTSSGTNDETWEWNGDTWTQRVIAGPSPRWSHRMAYDAARGVTVLFGGYTVSPYHNGETWELEPPCVPVSFASHPTSVALVPGSMASFSVSVSGPAPAFRWRHNGIDLADGPRVSGSTTSALMISSVQASDEGAYDCVVASDCNSVTSDAAMLSCDPILLSQPPESALLVAGLQLAVTVPANAPYSYRWRQNGQNLFNIPGFYSGVTTRTLTILTTDPSLEGSYDLVVTDACAPCTGFTCSMFTRAKGTTTHSNS